MKYWLSVIITTYISIFTLFHPITLETSFHKQMNPDEYSGEFAPVLKDYFGTNKIGINFCGVMTLMNVLDTMAIKETGRDYDISTTEFVNKYFVENGRIATTYEGRGSAFCSTRGAMSPSSLYYMAEKIGADTGLWNMSVIYGVTNFTVIAPVKKDDLKNIVADSKKLVFDNGGVIIAHVDIPSGSKFGYYHFITILDMRINANGEVEMLVIDSLGSDLNGYYGWVDLETYTFSGIYNLYGVIPAR